MRQARRHAWALVTVALLVAPACAQANAGSTLMWLGALHLMVGNFLIGIGEGLLLGALLRPRAVARAVGWMVPANYVSMAAGVALLAGSGRAVDRLLGDAPLYQARQVVWLFAIASFLLTVLIEWPFCAAVIKKRKRLALVSLGASLLAQTASYAVLVPLYLSAGDVSLFRTVRLDPSLPGEGRTQGSVYFVDPRAAGIYRKRLDGSEVTRLAGLRHIERDAVLFARRSGDGRTWSLWMRTEGFEKGKGWQKHSRQLLNGLPGGVAPQVRKQNAWEEEMGVGPVLDLRPPSSRRWTVDWQGNWFPGLWVRRAATGHSFTIALETPPLQWSARSVTLLPGDQVVFEFGKQVLLLDIATRRLALLHVGVSPVVALDR